MSHGDALPVVLIHRQPRPAGVGEAGVGGVVPLHRGPLRVSGTVDVLNSLMRHEDCSFTQVIYLKNKNVAINSKLFGTVVPFSRAYR